MINKLYIIGMEPGDLELVGPAANRRITESDVVIGGKRNLDAWKDLTCEKIIIGNNLEEIAGYITKNLATKKITVLASGDPCLYGITEYLNEKLKDIDIEVVPGISSLQYLCSRLKLSMNDIHITSVHGRQNKNLIQTINRNTKTAVFTGGGTSPASVCRELIENNAAEFKVYVGEKLSYSEERIVQGAPEDIAKMSFDSLAIMIIVKSMDTITNNKTWEYTTDGIPDSMFIRDDVPMTKEEVRAVSMARLRLKKDSTIFDVGAGTGSVSIECGLKSIEGKVYAIEKNEEAIKLLHKNIEKFNLKNVEVIEGKAPIALEGLPIPDRVFVGGTGGNMFELIEFIDKLCEKVRVVINTITIESTAEAIQSLERYQFKNIEISNISVSRGRSVGGKHLMQAQNPVYIISGEKGDV